MAVQPVARVPPAALRHRARTPPRRRARKRDPRPPRPGPPRSPCPTGAGVPRIEAITMTVGHHHARADGVAVDLRSRALPAPVLGGAGEHRHQDQRHPVPAGAPPQRHVRRARSSQTRIASRAPPASTTHSALAAGQVLVDRSAQPAVEAPQLQVGLREVERMDLALVHERLAGPRVEQHRRVGGRRGLLDVSAACHHQAQAAGGRALRARAGRPASSQAAPERGRARARRRSPRRARPSPRSPVPPCAWWPRGRPDGSCRSAARRAPAPPTRALPARESSALWPPAGRPRGPGGSGGRGLGRVA